MKNQLCGHFHENFCVRSGIHFNEHLRERIRWHKLLRFVCFVLPSLQPFPGYNHRGSLLGKPSEKHMELPQKNAEPRPSDSLGEVSVPRMVTLPKLFEVTEDVAKKGC